MLTVVRDGDTATTVQRRQDLNRQALKAAAAAPVKHLPAAFLRAVTGLFPELDPAATGGQRAVR